MPKKIKKKKKERKKNKSSLLKLNLTTVVFLCKCHFFFMLNITKNSKILNLILLKLTLQSNAYTVSYAKINFLLLNNKNVINILINLSFKYNIETRA